ncbi:MAG TPA: hypothetical protein VFU49_00015, partial [Ktedonobacteraceae bacterium]|nr:hypothetical protein [Ktedonobacteraceae bacterium]
MMKIKNNRPASWGVILLFSALFWLSYLLHANGQAWRTWSLGPFILLSVFPIIVGTLLQGLPGGLVAWFLTMAGLLIAILTGLGNWWPGWPVTFSCITINGLIVALVTGHLHTLGQRTDQEMKQEHHIRHPSFQRFFEDEDFTQFHTPSSQTRIKKLWHQITERAGRVAVPPRQAMPHFD